MGWVTRVQVLASAPDNLVAVHLKASKKGALNLKVSLTREKDAVNEGRKVMD